MLVSYKKREFKFADIFRVIVSGSSGVGKTHFVKELIQAKLFKSERVVLFHPDASETIPVDWHTSLDIDVVYKVGLPDVEYLKTLPEYTTIVIDDLFDQAISSPVIDYLVRVLSSKCKLHVFLLAQYYFAKGKLGVSIRDSITYHVLMYGNNRSTDLIARNFNLTKEIKKAEKTNEEKLYPYIFVARDNIARRAKLQVFTDIFSRYMTVIVGSTEFYLLSKTDFDSCLTIKDQSTAEYDLTEKSKCSTTTERTSGRENIKRRRDLERKIERAVQRYSFSPSL